MMIHRAPLLVLALILLSGTARAASAPVDAAIEGLKARAAQVEARLEGLGELPPERLEAAGSTLDSFTTFQSGWFGERNQYLSEVEGVRRFAQDVRQFQRTTGERRSVVDVVIALHRAAPPTERWRTSANASLILDTLFNTELVPAGDDLARHLEARRLFSELNFAYTQVFDLARPPVVQEEPAPATFVNLIAGLVGRFPGARGRAIRQTLDLLGVSRPTASIFADVALERLRQPETRERIVRLHAVLENVLRVQRTRTDGVIDLTLWDAALDVCGGDEAAAVELLGVFTTQHRTLLQTLMPMVSTSEERAGLVLPLILCASNFFLVQEIDELTRTDRGTFPFAYTADRQSTNRRFYHFWSEAFVAGTLIKSGFEPKIVRFVTGNLGRAYETYTLPLNIRFALKIRAKILPQLKGWAEDVSAHKNGAELGIGLFAPAAP